MRKRCLALSLPLWVHSLPCEHQCGKISLINAEEMSDLGFAHVGCNEIRISFIWPRFLNPWWAYPFPDEDSSYSFHAGLLGKMGLTMEIDPLATLWILFAFGYGEFIFCWVCLYLFVSILNPIFALVFCIFPSFLCQLSDTYQLFVFLGGFSFPGISQDFLADMLKQEHLEGRDL